MIIDFTIENYRSIKKAYKITFEAGPSKSKSQNIFTRADNAKKEFRLLTQNLIYGANASGKSNIIRGLYYFLMTIRKQPSVGDNLMVCDPYKFSDESENYPTKFEINFIAENNVRYHYKVSFQKNLVISEKLLSYPNGKEVKLIVREPENENANIHIFKARNKTYKVYQNQLALTKFGNDIVDEEILPAYQFLINIEVFNATNDRFHERIERRIKNLLVEDLKFRNRVARLIGFADTKIKNITTSSLDDGLEPDSEDEKSKKNRKVKTPSIYGLHDYYVSNELNSEVYLNFIEESHGTITLLIIGGLFVEAIENGRFLVIDELDTSLHPFVTKMLVEIFHSKTINTRGAQLLFTTHDSTLLDNSLFRKDQIWFTERVEQGDTEIYSLRDFEDVREDTPFEKWYLAGKFGGVPNIADIEKIFMND